MKKVLLVLIMAVSVLGTTSPASALTDTIEANTGFFVPNLSSTYNPPYYRWYNEDWGWTHNAISGTFTTATLSIGAYDVDWGSGEIDNIYVYDNGVQTLLGTLTGINNQYSYSTFTLSSNFFDDIANGLQVGIDIDSTHNYNYWAVALSKSVLLLDGGTLPDPNPGPNPVPEPSTIVLLGSALAGLAFWRKRRNA